MQSNRYMSLLVQSIYVLLTGLQLVFIPNMLLGIFGVEETFEVWIKVLGFVVISLSIIYYALHKSGGIEVVTSTVWARLFVGAGFIFLVVSGEAKPAMILFAGVDIATAAWTWFELKKVKA